MKLPKLRLKSILGFETLFVLSSTLVMILLYFMVVPFFELVELKAWDLHFRQRGGVKPSGVIGFVSIDEESVQRDGRWPWPRRQMAGLIRAVEAHGAAVIGMDMGFFEPDLKLRRQVLLDLRDTFGKDPAISAAGIPGKLAALAESEDDDVIVADTISKLSVPFVIGQFFFAENSSYLPPAPPEEFLAKTAIPVVQIIRPPRRNKLITTGGIEVNIPEVRRAAHYTGAFNVFADPDGSVRWMPLTLTYKDRFFPSLALQMLSAATETPIILKADDQGIVSIKLGPATIPTNNRGEVLVNYYGPGYSFPHYSATALLHDELPKDCLDGKIVVIGNTTMGLHDMRPTPFDPVFPGIELHCTVMENILHGQVLQRSERSTPFYDICAIVGIALLFFILQTFIHGISLAVLVAAMLAGYVGLTHHAFLRPGIWLNHIYPTFNLALCYLGTSVHRYLQEVQEKRKVRETFSLYVSGAVVSQMLADPSLLRLGGEKKELSVMFSDIRGFTTLSEQLPAEELVPELNHYLTRMTQIVFDQGGTLDKYIGDAVMAIFGAPITQEDHARRACATALEMMSALADLQKEWKEKGFPLLHIGIGINTGMMMVGNMGSVRRFDYTVLGDNVNLASRLEGLTKMYGVSIVVSESTWLAAKTGFVGRELDVVRVKGKNQPVPIHEIMAVKEREAEFALPLELYSEAMGLFRKGEWEKADALFLKVEEHWPEDAPSRMYRERCRELLDAPPQDDWSYITTLDHK